MMDIQKVNISVIIWLTIIFSPLAPVRLRRRRVRSIHPSPLVGEGKGEGVR